LKKGFGETDATFDQEGAVRHFAEQDYKDLYSFDLKSATDLIPQQLYVVILSAFLTKEIASAWVSLLTNREWNTPHWEFRDKTGKAVQRRLEVRGKTRIKYTRGQPMGALSSWGALAFVHHAIVRYSAFLVGETHFLKYLVLGDDVVIAGKAVADKYREVCESLGISLSLPKSYMSSEGLFNFASQTMLGNTNISPISFRKDLSMVDGFGRLSSLLTSAPRGFIDFSSAAWLQQIARFVLPRSVYSEMEALRLKGVCHPVIRVLGALLCGDALLNETGGLFRGVLAEYGITMPVRLILQPGLALFSTKLLELAQRDKEISLDIQAHKLLDRVTDSLKIRYTIARDAFLKEVGSYFWTIDGTSPFDEEGDMVPNVLIHLGKLVEIIVKPNKTVSLPFGRLMNTIAGSSLRVLTIPFLASFSDYLVDRLSSLYNEARLSKSARARDERLGGMWWKGGFKMSLVRNPSWIRSASSLGILRNLKFLPRLYSILMIRRQIDFQTPPWSLSTWRSA
jgi:hypothetical protein